MQIAVHRFKTVKEILYVRRILVPEDTSSAGCWPGARGTSDGDTGNNSRHIMFLVSMLPVCESYLKSQTLFLHKSCVEFYIWISAMQMPEYVLNLSMLFQIK